eukprot:CAMPEP_0182853602 /NCGR_PEP_ID=MMETSP0034_2-20130328/785_1 /TAXON_ID=156128 /ORGANISM="Nephroselmis pyriformis, Strain CCMP717" /LENGTH=126 /DNA_ID=CAMNT_0024984379 /DNA_START=67 /DNA_END=447 /DNA_ORIENTATION=-
MTASGAVRVAASSRSRSARAGGSVGEARATPALGGRRAALLSLGGMAAALGGARPAGAFGSGFPGYDINEEARKRAKDYQNAELQKERTVNLASTRQGNTEDPAEALIKAMAEQRRKKAAEAAASN